MSEIRKYFGPKGTTGRFGLGQIIKEIKISSWHDFDFCSKITVHVGSETGYKGFYLIRDPMRPLTYGQIYVKNDAFIKADPGLHTANTRSNLEHELPF